MTDMTIKLVPVEKDQKEILYKLYQFYEYDFSPYTGNELGVDGQYSVNLEHYWEDPRWSPYFICAESNIAGFLVILFENLDTDPDPTHVIYDFLILNKYRRKGIGKSAAVHAFNLYRANWKLAQMSVNRPALHFWRYVVNEYTSGLYTEEFREDRNKYIQSFSNRG
ncbi:GNAT family N-acetyltransferase [Paenibacillus sp. OV219]|uniref:GNAT family N-acetyltransferase n=1 Tax=Paenibacillus sp. OV219 TaxID=1884377 RepID=UPI0008B7A195|nr:GNAT family N-acetyltransferase [Paenibacillus sp. OV219]SEN86661.1 Predicted acetyltransferase [Paenibacillus sp. OV219]